MTNTTIPSWKAILSLLLLVGTLYVNYLANALPINGQDTGEISGKFPNAFVPAGLTFAIWGIIYLLLVVFVIQLLNYSFSQRQMPTAFGKMLPWFWLSCLMNGSWIFAFHYENWALSLLLMLVLLWSLIKIQLVWNVDGETIPLLLRLPFSVYLGWISVATLANVTLLLVASELKPGLLPEHLWSVFLMTLASGLGFFFVRIKGDIAFGLVIAWALYGIHLGQASTILVPAFAWYASLIMVLFALWETWRMVLSKSQR